VKIKLGSFFVGHSVYSLALYFPPLLQQDIKAKASPDHYCSGVESAVLIEIPAWE